MKWVSRFLLFVVWPLAAFYLGYVLTGNYFRWHLIPYPFEIYGIAVGLGAFFWALALALTAKYCIQKWRVPK